MKEPGSWGRKESDTTERFHFHFSMLDTGINYCLEKHLVTNSVINMLVVVMIFSRSTMAAT